MAVIKDVDQIRVQSGNNFKINPASTWETLGNIESGRFRQAGTKVEGTFANGIGWKKRGSSSAEFVVVLSQLSADIYKRVMELVGKPIKFYFYNGLDDNSEHNEIYSSNAEINEDFDIEFKANTPQYLTLNLSLNPAVDGSTMTVVPDTDLPTDSFAVGAVAVDSASPFIVMMNQAAA